MTGERNRACWAVPLLAGFAGFALGAGTLPPPVSTAPPPPGAPSPMPQALRPVRSAVLPPADLVQRGLLVPVQGMPREALQQTFDDARTAERVHDAIDIMAPRNTPVVAVEDGRIAKLFTSELGGLTVYQFDPTDTYSYYYAHLDHYASGLKEGDLVSRGQVIAYVGSTGNVSPDGPHLHFAINRLGPDKHWWEGEAINPYPVLRGR